jgi:acyl carrier protein
MTADIDPVRDRILNVIARGGHIDRSLLVPEATLETLGLGSIDVVEILMTLEEEFGVYVPIGEEISKAENVEQLVAVIKKVVSEKAPT